MPDRLTAFSFDNAVMRFGIWVENRLAETEGEGVFRRPRYTLEQLLDIEEDEEVKLARNSEQFMLFSMQAPQVVA